MVRARFFMARDLLNEEQQWAIEKPKLDSARTLRASAFVESGDMEFKETMKQRAKRVGAVYGIRHALQGSKPLEMGKLAAKTNPILADQNMHPSWSPGIPRGSALERLTKKIMKITLLGREFNSLSHYNLADKFFFTMPAAQ